MNTVDIDVTARMFSNNTSSQAELTSINNTTSYDGQLIGALVLCTVTLIATIYLTAVLVIYEVKVRQKNRDSLRLTRSRCQSRLVRDKWADWMRLLSLIGCATLLCRVLLETVEIRHGQGSDEVCAIIRPVKAFLQATVVTCIYLVLWIRQRKFYSLPVMEHLTNKYIRFLSSSIVAIMATADALTVCLYIFTRKYTDSERGCVVDYSLVWKKLPGLFLFLSTVLFQAILLGLLIYPLIKHRRGIQVQSTAQRHEIVLIRRVTVAALVTVAIDGLSGLIAITVLSGSFGIWRPLLYDVDMFAGLFCVNLTFNDWRIRFCPCFADSKEVRGTLKRVYSNMETEFTNTVDGTTTTGMDGAA